MTKKKTQKSRKPKKKAKTKAVMGRPKVFDDVKFEKLGEILRLGASLADCAHFFECGQRTIEDEIRARVDCTFREFRERNLVHTKLRLVQKAVIEAEKGNTVMHKFALKNLSDWTDKTEETTKNLHVHVDATEGESEAFKKVKRALLGQDSDVQQIKDVKPIRIKAGEGE